jgi:hypothetical protein
MNASAMAISGIPLEQQVIPTLPWAVCQTECGHEALRTGPSASIAKSLLLYGRDSTLTTTRSLILKAAGFTVYTANNSIEAERLVMNVPLDLCIFCSSVPFAEASGVLSTVRAVRRTLKSLVLVGGEPSLLAISAGNAHNTLDGPKALVVKIRSTLLDSIHTH